MRLYVTQRYSTHPSGVDGAYMQAVVRLRAFYELGFAAFSPIVNSHPADITTVKGKREPLSPKLYYETDMEWLRVSEALVYWEDEYRASVGVKAEVDEARRLGIPVVMVPATLKTSRDAAWHVKKTLEKREEKK
ncbi:MAG: DUF1937 family protein [Candidatus Omnitrophica bacterium]|nr:DUF1937 family protein [Candidatus Omnitrophota bacterium]